MKEKVRASETKVWFMYWIY